MEGRTTCTASLPADRLPRLTIVLGNVHHDPSPCLDPNPYPIPSPNLTLNPKSLLADCLPRLTIVLGNVQPDPFNPDPYANPDPDLKPSLNPNLHGLLASSLPADRLQRRNRVLGNQWSQPQCCPSPQARLHADPTPKAPIAVPDNK